MRELDGAKGGLSSGRFFSDDERKRLSAKSEDKYVDCRALKSYFTRTPKYIKSIFTVLHKCVVL